MRGRFLVLEGVDGSGKSTQAKLLRSWLRERGRDPLHLREPGTTALGERLRAILLDPRRPEMGTRAEALLFFAARSELLRQVVEPALTAGRDVICERFTPSTLAYQGHGAEGDFVLALDALVVPPEFQPDLVLILDLEAEESLRRARARGTADGFESRGLAFLEGVREGYRRYARARPDRARLIPVGGLDVEAVASRVVAAVQALEVSR